MSRLIKFVLVLAWLTITSVALAQPRTAFPDKRGFKTSDFPRLVRIAENVYGYEDFHASGMTTVSLFVVGRDGVLLADGQGSPAATQKLLDAIKATTGKPVKWYVVGSDHGDHTAGNSVLPKDLTWFVSPASRAQLERDAASATAANAKAAAEASAKGEAPRPPRVVVVPPSAMQGEKAVVDIGGLEVHVLSLGRAHTGGDLSVYLPQQRILFMSEAYLNRVFPAMRSAYPTEWLKTIDRALAMEVDIYVPGHGFIEEAKASREELVEYRKALSHVVNEARRLHALGLSADEARTQADWGALRQWYLADSQDIIAIRKIYEEIEGKLK